jgi:ABC-type phosphate/phosphonate transport system substrate-binding protein
MIASLPMYDLPEIRQNTDGFWASVAGLLGVNIELTREDDWSAPWREPNLLFSQTCGYPFTHEFAGQLTYVATPEYDADGCDGPNYCSIVFAKTPAPLEYFKAGTAAFNSSDSMSGYLALKLVFAPHHRAGNPPFFASAITTGSHVASLVAVQQGHADICAIDCVTVALLRRHRPAALHGLVEVSRSPVVPGLPLVTRSGDTARLRQALAAAIQSPSAQRRMEAMLIKGISVLQPEDYDVIPHLEKSISNVALFPND